MNTTKNNEIYNKHAMHIRAHEHRDLSGVKSNDTTTKQTHCHNLHMETTFSIQLRMKYYTNNLTVCNNCRLLASLTYYGWVWIFIYGGLWKWHEAYSSHMRAEHDSSKRKEMDNNHVKMI